MRAGPGGESAVDAVHPPHQTERVDAQGQNRRSPDTDAPADETLVQRAQAGDLAAFEELVTRHEGRVYALAWRMLRNQHDAEDITQQTFLDALEHLDSFRGDARFGTWLLRIATYAALKVIRKRQGLDTISLESAAHPNAEEGAPRPDFIADWRDSPEHLVHNRETARLIEGALDELDEKHRMVFLLRDVEGLSIRETAETLGIYEANVKVRLLRARLQLRERLTRLFGDPKRRVSALSDHLP